MNVLGSAGSDETAAIAAAIEQFRRDTAAPPQLPDPRASTQSAWRLAALVEGVTRQPDSAPLP